MGRCDLSKFRRWQDVRAERMVNEVRVAKIKSHMLIEMREYNMTAIGQPEDWHSEVDL